MLIIVLSFYHRCKRDTRTIIRASPSTNNTHTQKPHKLLYGTGVVRQKIIISHFVLCVRFCSTSEAWSASWDMIWNIIISSSYFFFTYKYLTYQTTAIHLVVCTNLIITTTVLRYQQSRQKLKCAASNHFLWHWSYRYDWSNATTSI